MRWEELGVENELKKEEERAEAAGPGRDLTRWNPTSANASTSATDVPATSRGPLFSWL